MSVSGQGESRGRCQRGRLGGRGRLGPNAEAVTRWDLLASRYLIGLIGVAALGARATVGRLAIGELGRRRGSR